MTRISVKDAARLGIVPGKGAKGVVSRVPAAAIRPRQSAKGGRIGKDRSFEPFDLRIAIPMQAKTKERARTMLPKSEIMKAFVTSRGSTATFGALLEGIKHRSYTPEDTKSFEGAVKAFAAAAMRGRPPYEGPVRVDIAFALTGDPGSWPTDVTDPDLDNAVKAIWDALNKVVWKDDRLVVWKTSGKACSPTPHIAVRVRDAASAPLTIET